MRLAIVPLFSALLAGQTLTLTGPATARPGQTIALNLTLSAPSENLAALQWTTAVPSGLTFTASAGAASNAAAKTLYCGMPTSQTCLTVGINSNLYTVGVVATYQVTVPANALPGNVGIPLTGLVGAKLDGTAAVIVAGTPYFFGVLARTDLNGDGKTDVLDLQLMIQEILTGTVTNDQNGDGAVNVLDAQIVAKAAVGP